MRGRQVKEGLNKVRLTRIYVAYGTAEPALELTRISYLLKTLVKGSSKITPYEFGETCEEREENSKQGRKATRL